MKKRAVYLLSILFPGTMAKIALRRLKNPKANNFGDNESPIMKQAFQNDSHFGGFKIRTYLWAGNNDSRSPQVLLVHGWEGQAGNFSQLIEKLVKSGYTVHAFDGPSHGKSSQGKTSLFEFTELTGQLIRKIGAKILISHSFGSVAVTYYLYNHPDVRIDKFILITAPDRFMDRIDYVSEQFGISARVKNKLIRLLEKETEVNLRSLNVSDLVSGINVKQSLIVHDIDDKVVSINQSRNVHKKWGRSILEEVEGTGHFRILKTDWVLDRILDFING